MDIKISRSRTGAPIISVGGGRYTNTYQARTVITPDGKLKTPVFVRTAGHLSNSSDQAIVEIQPGDIIVYMHGTKPADDQNPDAWIDAYRITEITGETAAGEQITITHDQIPPRVIDGLNRYHNRDGTYFCDADPQESV